MIKLHQRILDGQVVKEVRYYGERDEALPEVSDRAPVLVLLEIPNNLSEYKLLTVVDVVRLTKEQSAFILRSYSELKREYEETKVRLSRM